MFTRRRNKSRWHVAWAFIGLILALGNLGCRDREGGNRFSEESGKPAEVFVAAAADLKFALDEMIQEFRQQHPDIDVKVTYGSSGNFYSQLVNQAPFDMFFSADVVYPRMLSEAGLSLPESDFVYAVGRIVIWVPAASPIDIETLGIESLRHSSIHHIAIANPKHAPYGKAAEAAMRSLKVYEAVKGKLVFGENVAQTFQFVESGTAEIGFIARSLAVAPSIRNRGRYWEIPLEAYPKLEQGGVILKWTKHPDAARRFRSFVVETSGRALLKRHGFYLPGE